MLKHKIERFITYISMQMPSLMSRANYAGAEIFDGMAILEFKLPKPYDISDLLDEFDDQMELIILTISSRLKQQSWDTSAAPIPIRHSTICIKSTASVMTTASAIRCMPRFTIRLKISGLTCRQSLTTRRRKARLSLPARRKISCAIL